MNPYDGQDGDDFLPGEESDSDMITMNPPRWERWRPSRPLMIAGVALLALAGGAGVGYAATHSLSTKELAGTAAVAAAASPRTAPGSGPGAGRGYGFSGGIPGGPTRFVRGPLGAGLIHGTFTVPKSGGGYQTVVVQLGSVTAVSGDSLTVKSSDGYTWTYAVTGKTVVDAESAGIGSVKKGDTVFVTATVSGATTTAASILDETAVKAGHAAFGFPRHPANRPASPASPTPAQPPNA